jgi:hypothetical protein
VTVALAAICLGGQLSSVAHLVQVGHVTCAEHGELVHAEAGGAEPAPASDSALPAYAPVSAPPPAHGHEHCLVAGLRRDFCVIHDSAPAAVAPDERPIAGPEVDATRVAPFALFRLAPKNSPPV